MTDERARPALNLAIATVMATVLGGCPGGSQRAALQEPGVAPETPATVRADQIVGRWGVASYQDPKDRTRVEAAAKAQCKLPYVITAGASGGVVMHLADEAAPQDLRLKGSPGGKNYIGPSGPAGGEKDREVVSVDSRLLITRFVDRMQPSAMATWCTSAVRDDGVALLFTGAKCDGLLKAMK